MKTTGIILTILGALSLVGSISNAMTTGNDVRLSALPIIILGAFLIHRTKQKELENKKRKEWMDNNNT